MGTAALLLMAVGGLVALVGSVLLLVAAFRVSVTWGLLLLLLGWLVVPTVIFLVQYWPQARKPFLISLAGTLVWVAGFAVGLVGAGGELMTAVQDATVTADEDVDVAWHSPPTEPTTEPSAATPTPEAPTEVPPPPSPTATPRLTPTSTPTYTPTPTEVPTPVPQLSIPLDKLSEFVGRTVELNVRGRGFLVVQLQAIQNGTLRVEQHVGGGSIAYSLPLDDVVSARLVR